jgi:site-specific DNA-methyltransferase (adenine-specific)
MSKGGSDAPQVVRPDGRWPANICHDGSDEVVGAFPDTAPSKAAKDNKPMQRQDNNVYGKGLGSISPNNTYNDNGGSAARFFYSAKASKVDRAGSKHPTVKPIALMQWLARLITPPGGTVLDPFAGSGTTGAACEREGFRCVLVERESEYVRDIQGRFGVVPAVTLARLLAWNAAVLRWRQAA